MKTIYANPIHRHLFDTIAPSTLNISFAGLPIAFSDAMPKWVKKWQFPKERFFEYEPSDEKWCRYFGIGHEVETTEPFLVVIDMPGPFEFMRRPTLPTWALTA